MEKFARRCDITGRGMNEGWVWVEGIFYTSTLEITIKELRDDIECDAWDFDELGKDEILAMSDDELLEYAYENNVLYYTEWDEIDGEYYDAEGNEYGL
jgi:hypothetical protein